MQHVCVVCVGFVFLHVCREPVYVSASVLQCVSVILLQWVAQWVHTIPGFVCMCCCHAAYCTEWTLGSEACENPTHAHLEAVSCVRVCVRAHVCARERQTHWKNASLCVICVHRGVFMCVGKEVVVERRHSMAEQPLSVLDSTERFFIILLFH